MIALRFVMPGDLPIVPFLNGTEPINRWCDNDKDYDASQDRGDLI